MKMDEKGFIFTADAALALVVAIVLIVTLVSYTMLPMYMGQDHQHLEALAESALQVMEQDGTLDLASVTAVSNSSNATAESEEILRGSIDNLIPNGIGYRLTINPGTPVSVERNTSTNTNYLYSKDVVTRVKVISGPREGWWGRAWFKTEPVEFTSQEINLTTTSWMFHNWLSNFSPWNSYWYWNEYTHQWEYRTHLYENRYWGSGANPGNIQFTIPSDATILESKFIQGTSNNFGGNSMGIGLVVNNQPAITVNPNQFVFLNQRPDTVSRMYNYQGDIPVSSLNPGINNYYVNFRDMLFWGNTYDMPWFSILSTYTTSITVPVDVTTNKYSFQNTAGLAVPEPTELGNGTGYGRIYNLETGQVTNLEEDQRIVSWDDLRDCEHGFDNGIPFVITRVDDRDENGSAVSVVQDIDLTSGDNILDAYVVVNSWGAVDNALVEVWDVDDNKWETVFCSFDVEEPLGSSVEIDYSDRADGYGNLPGIIYIRDKLTKGAVNKVRITVWDDVPSNDYDLVGLQDCYTMVSTSPLNIKWDSYQFNSHQSGSDTETQTKSFTLTGDSQKAMLFLGVGLNTRNVLVEYADTGEDLYNGPIVPFSLDLAALDAQKGYHKITTDNSTATDYTLRPGDYLLRVTVKGPTNAWESGDWNSNAAIFSGTRIAVINPQIMNVWSSDWGTTPEEAMQNATDNLLDKYPNATDIHTSALYVGDMPNAVTVRLDLWKQ